MSNNELMTYGAIGFALFAASYALRKPAGQALANQPGQQQRDAGLLTWNQTQLSQWEHMDQQISASDASAMNYDETDRLMARFPAPHL